ncbi:MAG: DUF4406 domain-containing protein [Patescibacteria group bacterium]|nr:DUF4406 domain-containing protein [Patescibacteria group bacterium]
MNEYHQLVDRNPWLQHISSNDTVYLSGPMTNLPDLNRPAFARMEHALKVRGARVLSPAHADQSKIYHVLLRDGLTMVLSANVTVMLLGWEGSHGANVEWSMSMLVGNRLYYEQV